MVREGVIDLYALTAIYIHIRSVHTIIPPFIRDSLHAYSAPKRPLKPQKHNTKQRACLPVKDLAVGLELELELEPGRAVGFAQDKAPARSDYLGMRG